MMEYEPKPGDLVTCRHAVSAYYSGYAGRPEIIFEPGMRGRVAAIAAKVSIVFGPPILDGHYEMVVIDYTDKDDIVRRASLNFCNCMPWTDHLPESSRQGVSD